MDEKGLIGSLPGGSGSRPVAGGYAAMVVNPLTSATAGEDDENIYVLSNDEDLVAGTLSLKKGSTVKATASLEDKATFTAKNAGKALNGKSWKLVIKESEPQKMPRDVKTETGTSDKFVADDEINSSAGLAKTTADDDQKDAIDAITDEIEIVEATQTITITLGRAAASWKASETIDPDTVIDASNSIFTAGALNKLEKTTTPAADGLADIVNSGLTAKGLNTVFEMTEGYTVTKANGDGDVYTFDNGIGSWTLNAQDKPTGEYVYDDTVYVDTKPANEDDLIAEMTTALNAFDPTGYVGFTEDGKLEKKYTEAGSQYQCDTVNVGKFTQYYTQSSQGMHVKNQIQTSVGVSAGLATGSMYFGDTNDLFAAVGVDKWSDNARLPISLIDRAVIVNAFSDDYDGRYPLFVPEERKLDYDYAKVQSYTIQFRYKVSGSNDWVNTKTSFSVTNDLTAPTVSVNKRTLTSLDDATAIKAMSANVDLNCNDVDTYGSIKSVYGVTEGYPTEIDWSKKAFVKYAAVLDDVDYDSDKSAREANTGTLFFISVNASFTQEA